MDVVGVVLAQWQQRSAVQVVVEGDQGAIAGAGNECTRRKSTRRKIRTLCLHLPRDSDELHN